MLSNVRIGARVLLLIAVQCALLVIVGFAGLSGRAQSSAQAPGIYEKSIVPLLHLDRVLNRNVEMRARIEEALTAEGASNPQRLAEQIKGLDADGEKAWKEYAATPMNDDERKLAAQTMQAHEAMMAAEQQLITTLRTQGRVAAAELE